MIVPDMSGRRYERLTVVSRADNNKYGEAMWVCMCDCGHTIVTRGAHLRSGKTKSCGCYRTDKASVAITKHGLSGTAIYKALNAMIQRCENPRNESYPRYGGRGISVCSEWHDVSAFAEWAFRNGYMPGLTIERVDNDKGYSPDNCIFATRDIQNRNTSRVHKVDCNGEMLTTAQVGVILGVGRSTTAKWYREEGLRTLDEFVAREKRIDNPRYVRA